MSIKESMLNIVSDLAQNDYIRAVTYGGYSRRVEVSELAKSVVEDYTGSSLAGENQSVQGAFSALETEIQNVEQDVTAEINDAILNILPTDTASGEIASFPDGSDLSPALSVVAGIEPVQDLHGYDSPWPAGGGNNKYPVIISDDTWVASNANNSWSKDGDTLVVNCEGAQYRGAYSDPNNSEISKVIGTLSGTYTYSFDLKASINCTARIGYEGGKGVKNISATTSWQRVTTTATFDGTKAAFIIYNMETTALSLYVKNFQIEQGSTATAWSPYENICPISGHDDLVIQQTGANVWNEVWEVGDIERITGQNNPTANAIRSTGYIPVIPGTTYYAKCPSANQIRVLCYDANKAYIYIQPDGLLGDYSNSAFTVPNNCHFIRITTRSNYGATYNHDISINFPSTYTSYNAYAGRDYTIDLGQTVYGGTLTYTYADGAASWALDVTHGYKDIDDFSSLTSWASAGGLYIAEIAGTYTADAPSVCSMLEQKTVGQAWSSTTECYAIEATKLRVYTTETTLANFKTKFAQLQIAYELATPTTIQLTETQVVELFKGYNNVFSEAGDMSVTYKADIQLYIDKQTNELRVAILALS